MKKELTISEKMKRFIRSKGLQINEFEAMVGWPNGTVRKMTDSFKKERLLAVVDKFPDFDITDYLGSHETPSFAISHGVNTGIVGNGKMVEHNTEIQKQNTEEHDELIKLRSERDSIIKIIEAIDDPKSALSVISNILGASVKKS